MPKRSKDSFGIQEVSYGGSRLWFRTMFYSATAVSRVSSGLGDSSKRDFFYLSTLMVLKSESILFLILSSIWFSNGGRQGVR